MGRVQYPEGRASLKAVGGKEAAATVVAREVARAEARAEARARAVGSEVAVVVVATEAAAAVHARGAEKRCRKPECCL